MANFFNIIGNWRKSEDYERVLKENYYLRERINKLREHLIYKEAKMKEIGDESVSILIKYNRNRDHKTGRFIKK